MVVVVVVGVIRKGSCSCSRPPSDEVEEEEEWRVCVWTYHDVPVCWKYRTNLTLAPNPLEVAPSDYVVRPYSQSLTKRKK